ncbi:Zinc finger, CCHC-type [Gossypium australe]|uniref:Zinc finger, CCHC-type n=1 Tax=Gossypium australe TaxID=47621 RepID=A0A5B6WYA0_9ROSI|nr:Zinc finger, CCHC-type [Gossypium australe]
MLFVSLTPEIKIAGALSSAFYPLPNLFSGFLIPQPQIPKWWVWLYYLMPSSWTLNCLLTSQYGDVNDEIMVFGEAKTISQVDKPVSCSYYTLMDLSVKPLLFLLWQKSTEVLGFGMTKIKKEVVG